MSMKRRPQTELNHDNWNDPEEPDKVGEFEKADDIELKNRVIRVAKRRIRPADGDSDAPPKPNVFSSFSMATNKGPSNSESDTKPLFSFGGSCQSQPAKKTFTFSSVDDKSKPTGNEQEKSSSYCTKLGELNKAVLDCVKGHTDSGKLCVLSPVFADYIKYATELDEEEKSKPAFSSKLSSFSFGNTNNNGSASSTALPSASNTDTAAAASFSFSKPSASFGSAPTATGSSLFGSIKPFAPFESKSSTSADKPEAVDADENEEPPKVEFTPVVESESIYSKRCKVFIKADNDYSNRGTGTLYLKSVENKIQLIVRADTNLGNILLNILLTAGVPVKRLGKNNVMLICIPTPESDPKPVSVLVRVKTEDEADELLAEIQKHQK